MTEKTITPDTINGTQVWHLKGVRLTNRDLLSRTDAWVHFSDLGDGGWGLMASEDQIASWKENLMDCGITIEPWEFVPCKPLGMKAFIMMGVFGLIAIFLLGILVAMFVTIWGSIIITQVNAYNCRHIRFAPGMKSNFAWTSMRGSHVFPNQSRWG